MRVVDLTDTFRKTRALRAPIGSREDLALRSAIRRLASDRHALPDPRDEVVFRTPLGVCWMRPVAGTGLVVHFTFTPPVLRILAVTEAR